MQTIQRVRVQGGKATVAEETAQPVVVAVASPSGVTLIQGLALLSH